MPEVKVRDEQGNVHIFPDGSTPEMIAQAMNVKYEPPAPPSPAKTAVPRPGLLESYGRAAGAPTSPEEAAGLLTDEQGQIEGTPRATFNPPGGLNLPNGLNLGNAAINLFQNIGKGVARGTKAGLQEMREARQNIKEGGPVLANIGKAASGYADILSAGNPVIAAGGESGLQAKEGNIPGAIGSFLGGLSAGKLMTTGLSEKVPSTSLAERIRANAEKQYGQALNPTKERTKFLAQKRIPEMLQRGITAESSGQLRDIAQSKASAATRELNDIYDSLPGDRQSPTQPMIQAMDAYKAQFQDRLPISEEQLRAEITKNRGQAPGNIEQAADGKLYRVVNIDENAVNAADAMKNVIAQYGDNISPRSMRKVRQIFDESVAKAGGYEGRSLAEGSLVDAKREAATAIREQLAKDNPELVKLNSEINFWLDVQKIAAETAKRRVGQQGGLTAQLAKRTGNLIGAGLGYKAGGGVGAAVGAYAGGELGAKLAAVTQSTKWRTVSAVTKNNIANSLASGELAKANMQLGIVAKQLGITASVPAVGSEKRGKSQGASPNR